MLIPTRPARAATLAKLRYFRVVMVLLSPAWLVTGAMAAPPAEVAAASEDELIDRGIALREARNDAAALEAFRQAYDLKKGARALAQMALAEQALGHWVPAEVDLGQAISRAGDPWIARNGALLRQALDEIQGHLGTLELTGGPAGAEVFVNGASAGTLPLPKPLRVPAGDATLEVRAANYLPSARTVVVPRRGVIRETAVLVAAAAIPSAAPAADAQPGWTVRRKVGLAVGAAAVVSAVVGTTFLFVRDGRAKDFNDAGCGTAALTPSCASLRDNEKSAVTWSVTGLVGFAVLGGVSAYLLWGPSGHDASRVARRDRSVDLLGCTPSTGDGVSLTCGGRF